MHVRDSASRGMRSEVRAQPSLLRGAGLAAADLSTVAVQRHGMPRAERVGVIALAGFAGGRAEVGEVSARAGRPVLVVPNRRARARLVAAPRRLVAARVLLRRAVRIGGVAERGDRSRQGVDECGGDGRSSWALARCLRPRPSRHPAARGDAPSRTCQRLGVGGVRQSRRVRRASRGRGPARMRRASRLPSRALILSSPLPPRSRSGPRPPASRSPPGPPRSTSPPSPPYRRSRPRPPYSRSRPSRPARRSLPLSPRRTSPRAEPEIASRPPSPLVTSAGANAGHAADASATQTTIRRSRI